MPDKVLSTIGNELPTASVNRMVIGKDSIAVELVVKDQLDEQLTGTWFNNEKMGNLLKMVVVMSRDEEATRILSLGSDVVGLCDKTVGKLERESLAEEIVRLTKPNMLSGARRGLQREKRRILKLIDTNTEVRILNLSDDFEGSTRDIVRSEKQEIDGIEVSDIYYNIKYPLLPDEDHASIFSYIKMDIREFGERFGIDTSRAGLDAFNGDVDLEKIITSKKIIRRSRVFFRNGNIFNGRVRYSSSTGKYLSTQRGGEETLSTRVIRNPKVIDEREMLSVREIRTEFDNLSFAISSGNKISRDNLESKKVPSYFSPLMSTKDEDDNVRFMFSINTSEILTRNSIYGPLFANLSFAKKQDILERSLIRNIEVRRVRVKPSSFSANRLETEQTKGEVFDKDTPPMVICRTGESEPRSLNEINGELASFSEQDIFLHRNRGMSMRTFSGTDRAFSNITDGFYQYEVSVEVTDTIKPYLQEQVEELNDAISKLVEYYNFSTLISPTLEQAEISNPHIDLDAEMGGTEAPDKSHYEAYSNKFTRRFAKEASKKYGSLRNSPWISIPTVLVDLVSGFVSNFPEDKKSQIASSLRHSMSPVTGNPTKILSVIKMMESFAKKVADLSALPSKPTISASANTSTTGKEVKGTSKSPTKSFSATKRFEETFDTNQTKNFGFNYFDTELGSVQDLGLKRVSNLDYDDRVELETEKFLSDSDVDVNLTLGDKKITRNSKVGDASHSYFTPVSFLDSGVLYDFSDVEDEDLSGKFRRRSVSLFSKINTYSFLLEKIITDSKAKDMLERNNILSDDYNVTISPINQGNSFSWYPEQTRGRRGVKSYVQQITAVEFFDYLANMKSEELIKPSRFLSSRRRDKEKKQNISSTNPFKSVGIVSAGKSRRRFSSSFVISTLSGDERTMRKSRWNQLPNQIKSMYLSSNQEGNNKIVGDFVGEMSTNYSSDGFLEYKFTMGKIMQVMFLVGYDGTKSPIWRRLTKRRYDALSGKKVVCKLEPYRNEAVGYRQTSGLDLNVYNKCFLLDVQREVLEPAGTLRLSTAQEDGQTIEMSSMSPQQVSELDFDIVSDGEILKMNDLQLDKIPEGRRRRLSRTSSKVSRNGLMCNLLADEKENEEFKNAKARTGFVPTKKTRDTNKKSKTQKGDAY